MSNNLKIIIPGLVSFETSLRKINGFSLSEDFGFYGEASNQRLPFHYSVAIADRIVSPERYSFRSGYYFEVDGTWHYHRPLLGKLALGFSYDDRTKTFLFNRPYASIPFELGGIYPVGRHIADMISLDLFLRGYVVSYGCGFSVGGKGFGVIGPSFNGKTSLVLTCLEQGYEYLAEDVVIMDLKRKKMYGTAPRFNNFGRISNRKLCSRVSSPIHGAVNLTKMFFVANSTNNSSLTFANPSLDFLVSNSLSFLHNPFLRAYILGRGLTSAIFDEIEQYRTMAPNFEFLNINNFDYSQLIKKYDESK